MKLVSLVAIALLVSTAAVSCRKPHEPPPEVVSETVHCTVHEDGGIVTVDCLTPLREILAKEPDERIMGISPFYRDGGAPTDIDARLLLWLSKSERWPRAGDLEVTSTECRATESGPDCVGVIQDLAAKPSVGHYFVVPIYRGATDVRQRGTWSILDVHARARHAAPSAWSRAEVAYVPCHLDKGTYMVEASDSGILGAKRGDLIGEQDGADGTTYCESALVHYLRDHPAIGVIGIVALDSAPPPDEKRHLHVLPPGTQGLIVLTTAQPDWPPADSLALEQDRCDGGCLNPDVLIHDREARSRRTATLCVASLADWEQQYDGAARGVDMLMWLLPAP